MRTISTLSSIWCLASLVVLSGCKHVSSTAQYQNTVSEPVGVLVVNERPEASGVFVTVDENEVKPGVAARAESKPMRSAKQPSTDSKPIPEPFRLPSTKIERDKFTPLAPAITPATGIAEPLSWQKASTEQNLPVMTLGMAPAVNSEPAAGLPPADIFDSLTLSVSIVPNKFGRKEIDGDHQAAKSIIPVGLKHLAEIKTPDAVAVTIPEKAAESKSELRETKPLVQKNDLPKKIFAHAADYRWLIGELNYSSVKKTWRLRYAGLDLEDDYGGNVTLVGQDDLMNKAVDGRKVRVEGEILDRNGSPSPRYLVSKLTLLN